MKKKELVEKKRLKGTFSKALDKGRVINIILRRQKIEETGLIHF